MSKRLMPQFEQLVEEAVEKHSIGEDISWEVAFDMHSQLGPVWLVAIFTPNPIDIGEHLTFLAILTPPAKVANKPEAIDQQIGDAIQQLMALRSQALANPEQFQQAQQPQMAPGAPNGGPVPPPGLHGLPGGR